MEEHLRSEGGAEGERSGLGCGVASVEADWVRLAACLHAAFGEPCALLLQLALLLCGACLSLALVCEPLGAERLELRRNTSLERITCGMLVTC